MVMKVFQLGFLPIAAVVPFFIYPEMASSISVATEGISTGGSANSSVEKYQLPGEPIPFCNMPCQLIGNWGPLTIATTVSLSCRDKYPDRGYRAEAFFRNKYLCNNGVYWMCPRYAPHEDRCHSFYALDCGVDTCAPINP
jgi:hypothetical protein